MRVENLLKCNIPCYLRRTTTLRLLLLRSQLSPRHIGASGSIPVLIDAREATDTSQEGDHFSANITENVLLICGPVDSSKDLKRDPSIVLGHYIHHGLISYKLQLICLGFPRCFGRSRHWRGCRCVWYSIIPAGYPISYVNRSKSKLVERSRIYFGEFGGATKRTALGRIDGRTPGSYTKSGRTR